MLRTLLVIEFYISGLLLMSLLLAVIARGRRWRVAPAILAALLLAAPGGAVGLLGLAAALLWRLYRPMGVVAVVLSALYLAGLVVLTVRALRRRGESRQAAGWPRGRLAVASAVAVAITLGTWWIAEIAVRQQMMYWRLEAGSIATGALPPALPDAFNARVLYQQALGRLESDRTLDEPWDEAVDRWLDAPQEHQAAIEAFFDRHQPVLELLHKAAARPGFSADQSWPLRFHEMVEDGGRYRRLARLLSLRALNAAGRGDDLAAATAVSDLFALASHLTAEPVLIQLLVAVAIDRLAVDTLEGVLAEVELSDEALAALHVGPSPILKAFPRVIQLEHALAISALTHPRGVGAGMEEFAGGAGGPADGGILSLQPFFAEPEVRAMREAMDRYHNLARQSYHQARPKWEQAGNGNAPGLFTSMLRPSYQLVSKVLAHAEAEHRAASVGAAMLRYRSARGQLPETLAALTGAEPLLDVTDPFTGEPLKIVQRDGAMIVYSVGADLADDGGVEGECGAVDEPGDVAFTIPPSR